MLKTRCRVKLTGPQKTKHDEKQTENCIVLLAHAPLCINSYVTEVTSI
jgi:hypothetical protein